MSKTESSPIQVVPDSPARCQHRTLKGRCRQLATDSDGTLCFQHARALRQAKDDFTLLEPLVRKLEDLQTVEGIAEDLAELHNLLAQGRISPRRASVFAYIDSMLLHTVREIEEQAKGSCNYYGQPIRTYDWSSFPGFKPNSTGVASEQTTTESTAAPEPNPSGSRPDESPAREARREIKDAKSPSELVPG